MQSKNIEIKEELVAAMIGKDVVLFAGAGISTEGDNLSPFTLYENIIRELKIKNLKDISFPQLMSSYYEKYGSRHQLIKKVREYFDYIQSFPELYRRTTSFHRELATIPFIQEIITTNWDDYFEQECQAMPFVNEEDMAFWDLSGRKVLKIHGSIKNTGSLVATQDDYKKCQKNLEKGLIGSQLKLLLAKKTLVFVGYSFRDEDFRQVYNFIEKQIGRLSKRRYIVTPFLDFDSEFQKLNLEPIHLDGCYFLQELRKYLANKYSLLPLKTEQLLNLFIKQVRAKHKKMVELFTKSRKPEYFYCHWFQDGLIHAGEFLINNLKSGYTYELRNIKDVLGNVQKLIKTKRKKRQWGEVSYFRGFEEGLLFIIRSYHDSKEKPHFYYNVFLNQPFFNLEDFKKSFRIKKKNEKLILKEFKQSFKNLSPKTKKAIFHHLPFLY